MESGNLQILNADVAVDAGDAVAHCTPLHAGPTVLIGPRLTRSTHQSHAARRSRRPLHGLACDPRAKSTGGASLGGIGATSARLAGVAEQFAPERTAMFEHEAVLDR